MAAGLGPKAEQSLKSEWTLQERWRGVTKKLITTSSLLRILPSEKTKTGRGLERLACPGKEKKKKNLAAFVIFGNSDNDIAFI